MIRYFHRRLHRAYIGDKRKMLSRFSAVIFLPKVSKCRWPFLAFICNCLLKLDSQIRVQNYLDRERPVDSSAKILFATVETIFLYVYGATDRVNKNQIDSWMRKPSKYKVRLDLVLTRSPGRLYLSSGLAERPLSRAFSVEEHRPS